MKALALAIVAAAALGTAGAQAKAPKKGDPTKIVCRTDGVTGSRLGQHKRCLTGAQWAELASADRQALDRVQSQRYSGNAQAPVAGAFGRFQ